MSTEIVKPVYVYFSIEEIERIMAILNEDGKIFAIKAFRMIAAPTIIFGLKQAKVAIDYLSDGSLDFSHDGHSVKVMICKPLIMHQWYESEAIIEEA